MNDTEEPQPSCAPEAATPPRGIEVQGTADGAPTASRDRFKAAPNRSAWAVPASQLQRTVGPLTCPLPAVCHWFDPSNPGRGVQEPLVRRVRHQPPQHRAIGGREHNEGRSIARQHDERRAGPGKGRPASVAPLMRWCLAWQLPRNRADVGVPIAHGSQMDELVRACADYFYDFFPAWM
jgi:hypothetical protein